MTPRLDGGPIVITRETAIRDDETAGELEERLSEIGVDATLESVAMLSRWDGTSTIGEMQDASKVTKAPRLKKSDGEIDWGRTAREIDCHVRGMQPWPIAFTLFPVDGKPPMRLAIKKIEILDEPSDGRSSGEMVVSDGLLVATADRMIKIKRLPPAGKKEMSSVDFLRGNQPAAGTRLFS